MTTTGQRKTTWREGPVDRTLEHILLEYGDFNSQSKPHLISIGRIGKESTHRFIVEFLIQPNDSENLCLLEAAKAELDFYLLELKEDDPWNYAIYHCGTAANLYSKIHWTYFAEGTKVAG